MFRVEVHPAEGGADAAAFANELAAAVSKHTGGNVVLEGRVAVVECL